MASGPPCPQCGVEVQPGWDWCHRCGFDPDGLKPAAWAPPPAPAPPPQGVAPPWSTTDPFGPGAAPPSPAPTPTARRSGPGGQQLLPIVALAVVGILAIGGVGWFVAGRSSGSSDATSSTSSTAAPVVQLVIATGPDGSYTIGFPGRPDPAESMPPPKNPGQDLMGWSEDNAFDASASRGYLVLSQKFAGRAEEVHQKLALDTIGAEFGADPSAATIETTMLGHPARRFAFPPGGEVTSGIAITTPDHLYMILSLGKTPDDERQAVEASFRINETT